MQPEFFARQSVALWLCDLGLILAVCLLLFFRGIGATPFYDKQEAREASVVWEIHHSGNWILPLRNGDEIPAKPPFYHWLGAIAAALIGRVDEFTARLPSALLGTAGIMLTYAAGVLLWGRSAGLIAALVLSTSFEWQTAREARVDMALTFALLCSFLFFYYQYRTQESRTKAVILGLLLGLATLAKGPLGFVVPTIAFVAFLGCERDLAFFKKLHPIIVISVCAIVAGSWYLFALGEGGRDFLTLVMRENFNTVVGKEPSHPHPFWWYVPYLFQRMAPWSLFFPGLAVFLYRNRRRLVEKELLYFVVWAVAVLIFFSLFSQKRTVYILSAYPAIALLFGAWWQSIMNQDEAAQPLGLMRLTAYINAASFLILGVLLLLQLTNVDPLGYLTADLTRKDQGDLAHVAAFLMKDRVAVTAWAGLCGLGGIALIVWARENAWGRFVGCTSLLMVVSFATIQTLATELAKEYTFKPFMSRVAAIVQRAPLFFYGSEDYGVMFYADRHLPEYQPQIASSPFYMLVWQNEWKKVSQRAPGSVLVTSENTDREVPQHGHLLLVEVTNAEALLPSATDPKRVRAGISIPQTLNAQIVPPT